MGAQTGKSEAQVVLGVGARVVTKTGPGVIVDDYHTTSAAGPEYGRDWAISKRFAVALDNGALVFRDDEDLEAE